MSKESQAFPLADMSRDIRILTMICLALPAGMAIGVLLGARALLIPAILCLPLYDGVAKSNAVIFYFNILNVERIPAARV